MSKNGLPMKFKSVYTETGEEVMLRHSFRADYYWEGIGEKDKVYQSTGHTDSKGKEIFFGDVAVNENGEMGRAVMRDTGEMAFDSMFNPGFEFYQPLLYSEMWTVIGNVHHSREELERRAQELKL